MKVSKEKLSAEAQATGFRPEILEKVIHLLNLLEGFRSHPYLKTRLALKGGTALNLFQFDIPRLSVDIDLNYIGAVDMETLTAERPKVEEAVQAVYSREGLHAVRMPSEHAGGKWRLRYNSSSGEGGNLEIDLNFMFRVPLWPVVMRDSKIVGSYRATAIPVLDLHELAAGKLAALLSRRASRDLFDAHQLLKHTSLDRDMLRLGFVLLGAMNRKDWRTVTPNDINFEPKELEQQLIPVIRREALDQIKSADWAKTMIKECREGLDEILPFTTGELDFLDLILDQGEIRPDLLTDDKVMQRRIASHPLLQWKAQNARNYRAP